MDDRTVANELQNGSTQSSLACKSCRRKKLKCDRNIPQCRNCLKAARSCEYPSVAHKPGPRPGTHRRNGDVHQSSASKPRSIVSNDSPHGASSQFTPESGQSPDLQFSSNNDSPFSLACKMMRMPEQTCTKIIQTFFDNMTCFGLFHQPTFSQKIASISSAKQIQALITSMFAFSVRYMQSSDLVFMSDVRPNDILEKAYTLNHECLAECSDETPPLHLLQGFLLVSWLISTFGVRGRSWRLVGQCIRMAYELRLHEVDLDQHDKHTSSETNPETRQESWVMKEEKRRAWWTVWECDIFASTIQRLPNGIDWSRCRTLLPSTNEAWFNNNPSPSCYFRVDPNKRWRDLRDSGNESPLAWFLLLNSYKFDSLSVTQRMTPPTTFFENEDHLRSKFDSADYRPILARKREVLENCLRCALGAIPASLQPDGYLSFEPARGHLYPSQAMVHDHGVYMIHVMSQVTQLMLSRKDLEGGNYIAYPADFTLSNSGEQQGFIVPATGNAERKRWQRCLLASDKMTSVVRNSSPTHYRHVNPNIATALWMAAAGQLAVLAYHPDEIDVDLARSNLDLLTTTIESFIDFWDVPKTLIQSLATLEQQLRARSTDTTSSSSQQPHLHSRPDGTTTTTAPLAGGFSANTDNPTASSTVTVPQQQQQEDHSMDELPAGTIPPPQEDMSLDVSPFDVLQAMDFGAMYNGVENWENLFLDPGFASTDVIY